MSSDPLLSICIPTFNRLHYLKEALSALMPQAQVHGVEICVSDNHSTDGTAQFLEELARGRHSMFRYVVQESNIGLDRNMIAAIGMGKGQYIYPIGDDDVLPSGSLTDVLHGIEKGCDLLVLNGWHTTPSLNRTRIHLPEKIAGHSFTKPDAAFTSLWDKMPFGSFLGSRDCFETNYFGRFLGTSHAYTGAVWDALADISRKKGGCNVICMEKPTVLLRGGEKSWRRDAAKIMLHEIPLWFSLLREKDPYSKIVPPIMREYLKSQTRFLALLQFRAINQLANNDVAKLASACTPLQRKKMALVAKTPKKLARILVDTTNVLRALKTYFFQN